MSETPDVSIIVPSYNTAEATLGLLGSIHAHTRAAFEIIVVDDASSDGTPERIREAWPAAAVIVQPRRSGFAAACNAGIREARAELLFLLNSDIVVRDDAIDRMIAFMHETRAGACGCRLTKPDGRPQPYSIRVPKLGEVVGAALGRPRETGDEPPGPVEAECLQGSCLMISREAIEKTGSFDEAFFLYCEDIDWCIRARAAGLRLFYLPEVAMVHRRGLSTSRDVWRMTWHYHRSLWRLYRKHFAAQHNWLVSAVAFAGLCARGLATLALNLVRKHKSPRWKNHR